MLHPQPPSSSAYEERGQCWPSNLTVCGGLPTVISTQ